MKELRINYLEKKDVWDAFVRSSPDRSIFATSKFIDSLNQKYDLITCYDGSLIVAGMPILINKTSQLKGLVFPYQGVLLQNKEYKNNHSKITNQHKILSFFINEISKYYDKYYLSNTWRFQDLRAFNWLNYDDINKNKIKMEVQYTGIIDVSKYRNFEHYKESIRTVRRQEINKASASLDFNFTNDLDMLVSLYIKTFERQGIDVRSKILDLVKIVENALFLGFGKIGVAFKEKVPISASLFIYDDRTAYYLFAANDPAYRSFNSGAFVLMNMIKYAFDNNLSEVDLLGLNSPNRGDFKISFNPEIKSYINCSYNDLYL